jgi:hypothetical protein
MNGGGMTDENGRCLLPPALSLQRKQKLAQKLYRDAPMSTDRQIAISCPVGIAEWLVLSDSRSIIHQHGFADPDLNWTVG